jgi:hypothetical protein
MARLLGFLHFACRLLRITRRRPKFRKSPHPGASNGAIGFVWMCTSILELFWQGAVFQFLPKMSTVSVHGVIEPLIARARKFQIPFEHNEVVPNLWHNVAKLMQSRAQSAENRRKPLPAEIYYGRF